MAKIHSYDETVISFHKIDHHVRMATPSDFCTFYRMKEYLCQAIPANDKHKEFYLARGIVVCMGCKWNIPYSTPENFDTPLAMLKMMRRRHVPYSEVFEKLGYDLGLEVETINGRRREAPYQAGDTDSPAIQKRTWNAVKLAGKWHLLCPDWIFTKLLGFTAGGERLLEAGGEKFGELETKCDGIHETTFDDFWFLTNPDIARWCLLPDDDTWQLLPDSKKVQSVSQFLDFPFAEDPYFQLGLSILCPRLCKIRANKGTCIISLLADKTISSKLVMTYMLHGKESEALSGMDFSSLPLLVLNSRNGDIFTFEIRFPVEGVYMFDIFGQIFETGGLQKFCSFRIQCDERKANFQKLPVDASETGGWGHGPSAEIAGLRQLPDTTTTAKRTVAKLDGSANVDGGRDNGIIAYRVDDDAIKENIYETVLYGSDEVDEDHDTLQDNVRTTVDEVRGQLAVHATVPKDGEYALVLKVGIRHGEAKPNMKAVCTYLLTTETSKEDEAYEKIVKEKKVEVVKQQKRSQREDRKKRLEDEIETLQKELTSMGEENTGSELDDDTSWTNKHY